MENYYVGTELKFAFNIISTGFEMATDNWIATITNSNNGKLIVCSRGNNAIISADGLWYLIVSTKELGVGNYYIKVEIDVPDKDFSDGLRHEVLKLESPLCNVLKV